MLINGFGAHNIQGIDKHIPLIHNVMNTDVVVDISDRHTDRLNVLFNTDVGRAFLASRGSPRRSWPDSGPSGSRRSATCSLRSRPQRRSTWVRTT